MISFYFGTTAEYLKLRNVMSKLLEAGVKFDIIFSGQHHEDWLKLIYPEISNIKISVVTKGFFGKNLSNIFKVIFWFPLVSFKTFIFFNKSKPKLLIIHGDTLSTLIGGVVGKIKKIKIAHIEAGYRSGNFFNPFPEEIVRILVSYLTNYHLAPGEKCKNNIIKQIGKSAIIVDTKSNTAIDNLKNIYFDFNKVLLKNQKFFVVSVHRTETLQSYKKLNELISLITYCNEKYNLPALILSDHRFSHTILKYKLQINQKNIITSKLDYETFISNVFYASFVITDSGGLHQECEALKIPTIIYRKTVENAYTFQKSQLEIFESLKSFDDFLKDVAIKRNNTPVLNLSPSEICFQSILKWHDQLKH